MKNVITLKWVEKGQKHVKQANRQEMLEKFQMLVRDYQDNNEISIKLTKIIPTAKEIRINKDYNATQEIPCITYVINEAVGILKILRHHKIVWSVLHEYCKED